VGFSVFRVTRSLLLTSHNFADMQKVSITFSEPNEYTDGKL